MKLVLSLVLGLGLVGCSSHVDGLDNGTGGNGSGGSAGSGGGDGGGAGRGGGGGGSGGSAGGATNPPPGGTYPIKHVVVVVKENHTFDNYFGSFPGAEAPRLQARRRHDPLSARRRDRTPRDLCHAHDCALTDWNQRRRWTAGTSAARSNGDHLAFAQYSEDDIPNYWAVRAHFTLADHFFANVLGPSFPGPHVRARRAGRLGAPATRHQHPPAVLGLRSGAASRRVASRTNGTCTTKHGLPLLQDPERARTSCRPAIDWKFYGIELLRLSREIWSMFDAHRQHPQRPRLGQRRPRDAVRQRRRQRHTLPAVSWLVDQDLDDEHPHVGGVCNGENWTVGHINQIMQSDYWKDTAILFTMDDFGGWYDHVPPPRQYGCDAQHALRPRLPPAAHRHLAVREAGLRLQGASRSRRASRASSRRSSARRRSPRIDPAAQDGQANDLMTAFDFTQTPLPPLTMLSVATASNEIVLDPPPRSTGWRHWGRQARLAAAHRPRETFSSRIESASSPLSAAISPLSLRRGRRRRTGPRSRRPTATAPAWRRSDGSVVNPLHVAAAPR